ncbi:MAG: hypothetical protein LBV04_00225, partial [Deferribacteraceae bacterium]|nr:hypothetical protein [Deferribacteraceae bacterium]
RFISLFFINSCSLDVANTMLSTSIYYSILDDVDNNISNSNKQPQLMQSLLPNSLLTAGINECNQSVI